MGNISMEAAHRIWTAHREIEVGQKLLADIAAAKDKGGDPTPLDPFGRRRQFSFGVPMGDSGERMFNVSNALAVSVIKAHIADKQRELVEATEIARLEMDAP